jgi:hypothetical protein
MCKCYYYNIIVLSLFHGILVMPACCIYYGKSWARRHMGRIKAVNCFVTLAEQNIGGLVWTLRHPHALVKVHNTRPWIALGPRADPKLCGEQ